MLLKNNALKIRIKLLITNIFLLSTSLSAIADNTTYHEEVIVNATRVPKPATSIPAAIAVVNKNTIQLAQQQLGLDESLTRVPGLFLQNRYNFAQDLRVAIRGSGARGNFGVRGVKIIVDGIPNTLPDGQGQLDSIDISSIGQIEVLRGPSSSLYGNASGGVINITSESAPDNPILEIRSALGEYGYTKSQIKTTGKVANIGYLVSASYMELDGYREHSEAENKNVNSRIQYTINETSDIVVVANLFDSPISQDPGGINTTAVAENPSQARDRNIQFAAGEAIKQQKIAFKYRNAFTNQQEIIVRSYHLSRNFENSLPFTSGGIVQFDRIFSGVGLQYIHSATLWQKDNRFTIGADYDLQKDDRKRFNNNNGIKNALIFNQREEVSSLGVFIQNELSLNNNLEMTTGLRYDDIEFDVNDKFLSNGNDSGNRELDALSANLGLLWQMHDSFNLYVSTATSFETPTTTELANPVGGGFNQNIDPQKATNYELGIKGISANNKIQYDLALFSMKVEDELTPFELAIFPGRTFFENAGKSTRQGLEFALSIQLVEGLHASTAYTYSDFTFDRFSNTNGDRFDKNYIPGIPKHYFHSSLNYQQQSGLFVSADLLYVGEFYANNANTVETDAYPVANIRMGWKQQWGEFELTPFLGINNLFDEQYSSNVRINAFGGRYFEPAPKRNTYGGVSLTMQW